MYRDAKLLIKVMQNISPGGLKLALLVSLASRIEPELLRAMRLNHLPDVDASAEADLWFSPLISASSPLGIAFQLDILLELRKQLAAKKNRELLDKAWDTLQRIHGLGECCLAFQKTLERYLPLIS